MNNFLNGSFLGTAFATGYTPTIPEPTSYDEVTFYGGDADGCIIDKVYGLNESLTKKYIDEYSNIFFKPVWSPNTYLLCEFDNNYSGGNMVSIENPISNWLIYRSDNDSSILKYIDTVEATANKYTDFTALKNKEYTYYLFGKNDVEISAPIKTKRIESYYHGWFLIDVENNISYMFDLNFSGGSITQVENISEYDTNLPYKAYSKGFTNYIEGNIKALVIDDYCNMNQSIDILEKLRELIFSDRPKYLKDNKGRIFKVFTSGYVDNVFQKGVVNEPRYISFDFKEVGEV